MSTADIRKQIEAIMHYHNIMRSANNKKVSRLFEGQSPGDGLSFIQAWHDAREQEKYHDTAIEVLQDLRKSLGMPEVYLGPVEHYDDDDQ